MSTLALPAAALPLALVVAPRTCTYCDMETRRLPCAVHGARCDISWRTAVPGRGRLDSEGYLVQDLSSRVKKRKLLGSFTSPRRVRAIRRPYVHRDSYMALVCDIERRPKPLFDIAHQYPHTSGLKTVHGLTHGLLAEAVVTVPIGKLAAARCRLAFGLALTQSAVPFACPTAYLDMDVLPRVLRSLSTVTPMTDKSIRAAVAAFAEESRDIRRGRIPAAFGMEQSGTRTWAHCSWAHCGRAMSTWGLVGEWDVSTAMFLNLRRTRKQRYQNVHYINS